MSAEDYTVITQIGRGSFGTVSKIVRNSDGKELVWKEMDYGKMNEKEKQQLVSEVNILRELRHAHIVRYYDRIIDRASQRIYVVMEYCPGGDLGARIKQCQRDKRYIDEEMVWKTFTQCLLALNECHNRAEGTILHRDIKPGNIFLDANDSVKLGDFGLARVLDEKSEFAHTYVGTPFYMSPEQIREQAYNNKSDIWSLGCVLYEMCALVPPFQAKSHLTLAGKIKNGQFARIPDIYSDSLHKVIAAMLNVQQEKRPDVERLMQNANVALRLRERKVTQHYIAMKNREAELAEREAAVAAREAAVAAAEARLGIGAGSGLAGPSSSEGRLPASGSAVPMSTTPVTVVPLVRTNSSSSLVPTPTASSSSSGFPSTSSALPPVSSRTAATSAYVRNENVAPGVAGPSTSYAVPPTSYAYPPLKRYSSETFEEVNMDGLGLRTRTPYPLEDISNNNNNNNNIIITPTINHNLNAGM